jgi:hypothetical protein
VDASKRIDREIADHPDWRGRALAEIRRLVRAADPDVVEEWKWMGTSTWTHGGLVCAADIHTRVVKVLFFKGASLRDPKQLFNGELEGKVRRAIKLTEGDRLDEAGFQDLVRAAVALNAERAGAAAAKGKKSAAEARPAAGSKPAARTKTAVKKQPAVKKKPAAKKKPVRRAGTRTSRKRS